MNCRAFVSACSAAVPVAMVISPRLFAASDGVFEVSRSEPEWRAMLTETEYAVMREEATERAGSSPLNGEKRAGTYLCRGCDLPLYSSSAKYDSGSGSHLGQIFDDGPEPTGKRHCLNGVSLKFVPA